MAVRRLALVPAAGRGERFGDALPKMTVELAGRPILVWAARRLVAGGADEVVVAVSEELAGYAAELDLDGLPVRFTRGGATRQESVAACLAAAPGPPDGLVLVHDGARPAVDPGDVARVTAAAERSGAAILGRPVADTLKRVARDRITGTVDRSQLFRAETPQVFRREILERAFERARRDGFTGTDESSLVERLDGVEVTAVAAARPNPKLTAPGDLTLLERLLAGAAG
ncbi:MAG: 2-C-methyl-D-erythritol 4-phosphate cytidylyltransferase [Thermoanaerobaculia bacterium]|nr:2-C-methyl-D-erythritol 4-phosphate cytidylyltransferase [Thermoanaerobaculia bacterium]